MQSVDSEPNLETWTATVHMKDAADLPDVRALRLGFRQAVGNAFVLRGVEVAVDATVVADGKESALLIPGRPTLVRLKPLGRKVQWDPKADREQPATDEERTAHARLVGARKAARAGSVRVRVVGVLEEGADGEPPTVAVREFRRRDD